MGIASIKKRNEPIKKDERRETKRLEMVLLPNQDALLVYGSFVNAYVIE